MHTTLSPHTSPPAPTDGRPPLYLAAASSLFTGLLAGLGLVLPAHNPLNDPGTSFLSDALGATGTTGLIALLSLVSVLVALAARVATTSGVRGTVIAVAVANIAILGLLAQGSDGLAFAGYLMALVLPLGLIALAVLLFRSYRAARVPLLLGGAALIVGMVLLRDIYFPLLALNGTLLMAQFPTMLMVLGTLGTAAVWAAAGIRQTRGRMGRLMLWATRHRVALTILAALGPAPYIVLRSSWLTPWPLFQPDGAGADVRIWGLLLGACAVLGVVLTIGLIRPWGERLPRWFPVASGQPVPPRAAIIPGATVAVLVTAAALPMLLAGFTSGVPLLGIVLLPLWFWGPMLGLAVLGYAGHRRGVSRGDRSTPRPATPTMGA